MPRKAYVLLETSYEYNDEIYSTGESLGGSPLGVYMNKKDAEEAMKEKVIDAMRDGLELSAYYYDVADLLKCGSIGEFCTDANDAFEDLGITFLPDNLEEALEQARKEFDDKPLYKLYQMLDLDLFYITQVPVEDCE